MHEFPRNFARINVRLNIDLPHDAIQPDEENGAYSATRHLQQLGHESILYVGPGGKGDWSHFSVKARYEGYQRAMLEAGLEPQKSWNLDLERHLKRHTAVLTYSNGHALNVIRVAGKWGFVFHRICLCCR